MKNFDFTTEDLKIKNIVLSVFFLLSSYNFVKGFNFLYNYNIYGGHEWYTAEWLINYNYGFIRRGLFGTFILNLPLSPQITLIFLTVFLSLIYLGYIITVCLIYLRNDQNFYSHLILFSPAFLLFHSSNPEAIFRKELIGLLSVALFSFNYVAKNKKIILSLSYILFVVAIFSAEYNLYFVPLVIYLMKRKQEENIVLFSTLISIPIFIYFYLYVNSIDTALNAKLICTGLKELNYHQNICVGAIDWLGLSITETYNRTTHFYDSQYYYYLYYFLVGIGPLILSRSINKNKILFLLYIFLFIPLFIVSIDWGRHIFMLVSIFSILQFSEDKENKKFSTSMLYFTLLFLILFYIPYWEGSIASNPLFSFKNNNLLGIFSINEWKTFFTDFIGRSIQIFKIIISLFV